MPQKELPKIYNPANYEDAIYARWEKSGFFNPDNLKGEPYAIMMPPPNVTGVLHLGHALENSLMDIMARYQRMSGKKVLFLPGTDHAAVATQAKVEKVLIKQGLKNPRQELGREKFLEKIRAYSENSQSTILKQIRKMGASCDWSRLAYTFDEARGRAVNEVFVKMYNDGLIYRGKRIINWDAKLQTTISDDEIVWQEEKAPFYYLQYGPFVIATARPETKFGDKYVVMHPDDKRYKKYKHGDKFDCEWINGRVTATVIKDKAIDPKFGSGVMTITPWHDLADFEIAERHNLSGEQIIDFNGKLLSIAGEFAGLDILTARPKIVEKLKSKGLVKKVEENYLHRVAKGDRSNGLIEPQIKEQWFVAVNKIISGKNKSLKDLMREAVTVGHNGDAKQKVKITPERFKKIYLNWIDNLRDWCISRQIWWGHRIPVYYRRQEISNFQFPISNEIQNSKIDITYFVHGTTTDNEQKKRTGWRDGVLSDLGKKQNLELKETIRKRGDIYDVVFASDLKRAEETAETVFGDYKIDKRLRECDYGDLNGQPEIKFKAEKYYINNPHPNGESYKDVEKRIREFLSEIAEKYKGQKIAFVSHMFPQLALEVILKNKTWEQVIDEDWRKKKGWQAGWRHELRGEAAGDQEIYVGAEAPANPNFIFLHGFYRTRVVKDPLKWLNSQLPGEKNFWEILPQADEQMKIEEQAEYVLKNAQIDENTVIVAHSRGGKLAMRILQESGKKIKGLVLIAVGIGHRKQGITSPYDQYEFDFDKIKRLVRNRIVLFEAAEDHVREPEAFKNLAEKLDAKHIKSNQSASHYNQEQAPEILEELKKFLWQQDPDTLDTWFSSSMWTFSTLGWPARKSWDLKIYDGQEIFASLKTGVKRFETRAGKPEGADKDWRQFKAGEIINFSLVEEGTERLLSEEIITKQIVSIHHFKTVDELLKKLKVEQVHPYKPEEYRKWWEARPRFKERIEKYGLWAFELKDFDLKIFHPTAWMQMGYEIIFLWLVRMVLMGTYVLDQIPFRDVYIHGILRSKQGKKFSKSSGDNIDPLEIIKKYGTDALRLSVISGIAPGNDSKFYEEKVEGARNMVNKLWNVARYIITNYELRITSKKIKVEDLINTVSDDWIITNFNSMSHLVKEDLDNYRFSQASETLYEFTWNYFADWYLEISKLEKNKDDILFYILKRLIKLWHPFMPFVTEAIWQNIDNKSLLMVQKWPEYEEYEAKDNLDKNLGKPLFQGGNFEVIKDIIIAIRNARAENKVEPARKIKAVIYAGLSAGSGLSKKKLIEEQAHLIKNLRTGIGELEVKDGSASAQAQGKGKKYKSPLPPFVKGGNGAIYAAVGEIEIYLIGAVDETKEKARLEKEVANLEKIIASTMGRLANKEFTAKAPAEIVKKEKAKLKGWQAELKKFKEQMGEI